MKKLLLLLLSCTMFVHQLVAAGTVSGELKRWHKVSVDFTGPQLSEDNASTFLNYRLDVTFTNGTNTYVVPGFFAADGNAGESAATAGKVWRVNFCPDKVGTWTYTAAFRTGTNVAVANNPSTFGTDASIHGNTGTFNVSETDKTGRDMRSKGRLRYVGKHHLQYEGSGEYFMKAGPDSPENLLAYYDIDNTGVGGKSNLMKDWAPHVTDWNNGDPTWKSGKGKGLIGALNYLADEKMNAISFLTMNSPLGDDRNVVPWITKDKQTQYDCSKLDQWEIIFSHAQKQGLFLHFKTQETENELILDNGALGTERKLYYRELIARFGHHNALEWNICEEGGASWSNTNQTQEQRKQSIAFFADNDPYQSNVVVHTAPGLNSQKAIYNEFVGNGSKLTGVSLQNEWDDVFETTKHWVEASADANRSWVVANDEQGNAQIGVPHDNYTGTPTKDDIRKHTLWGNLMAGGAGVNYYFGYGKPDGNQVDILFNYSDMSCEDFRSRDISWDYARYAVSFFDLYIPFWEMHNDDSKTSNGNSHCLLKDGDVYVVYLRNGGTTNLTLAAGTYNVDWFNPKTGGALTEGTRNLNGGGAKGIGNAPSSGDWVAIVRNTGFSHNSQWGNGFSVPNPNNVASVSFDENLIILGNIGDSQQITATVNPSSAVDKSLYWVSSDENVATVTQDGFVIATGNGRATIVATANDGSNKSASAEIVVGTTNCDKYTYGANWVVFEADITSSNLDKWAKRTPSDAGYMQGTRTHGPIGNDYLEFTGNNENGGTATSPLVYVFTAPKTGKYRLGMRLLQNLEGAEWDKSNDVYIRLEGNFTSGNAFSTDDMKHDHKFYGRGKDNWGAGINMEGHVDGVKTLTPATYNLIEGEEYTFTMSGRAQRTCIDYIIFFENGAFPYTIGEEKDIASENADTYWPDTECDGTNPNPGTCQTILSKDFDKISGITGYDDANLAAIPNSPANSANVGEVVLGCGGANGKNQPCAAEETYTGAAGNFFFKVNAMGEPDGECTYEVFVNGVKVGEKQITRIHGTTTQAYTVETLEINSTAVALKSGDVIRVTFDQVSNDLVVEGTGFATARGRWRSIEICSDGGIVTPPLVDEVDFVTVPSEIGSVSSVPIKVSYTASEEQEVVAIITSPTGEWLGNQKITVQKGSGELDMDITIFTNPPLAYDNGYNVSVMIRPVGSSAADAIDEKSTTIDVVSTVVLSPIHDAYLQGTTLFNNIDLRVENGNRVSYIQFDLSSIGGDIESMELELTVGSDAGNGTVNILDGSHSNWTETNLSSTNAPGQGASLDVTTGALAVGQSYIYDVSAVSVIDNKVTFVVTMNTGGNDVSFASKENTTQAGPVLKVKQSELITGFESNADESISIYPNPTSGKVALSHDTNWELYSPVGIMLGTGTNAEIDLTDLPQGIYIIKMDSGVERVVKQ